MFNNFFWILLLLFFKYLLQNINIHKVKTFYTIFIYILTVLKFINSISALYTNILVNYKKIILLYSISFRSMIFVFKWFY